MRKKKFKFNFTRSVVFAEITCSSGGNVEIKTAFHSIVRIPEGNVWFSTTKYLRDTSTILVDFGPKGRDSKEAIIAAGSKKNLPAL